MKRLNEKIKLSESGLSKVREAMEEHDVICISASKYLPDRADYDTQDEYEKKFVDRLGKQKKLDRDALLIALKGNGYGVIKIKGFYQYSAGKSAPSKEDSFCVVNRNDDSDFLSTVLKLAVKCKQNSIYYVPKGTFEGYWIFTGIDLSEPDEIDKKHHYGDKECRGPVHFGSYVIGDDEDENNNEVGYSLVNGRPFSSYKGGNVYTKVNKVKTKNTSKNITIIDESVCETVTLNVDAHTSSYLRKFNEILK